MCDTNASMPGCPKQLAEASNLWLALAIADNGEGDLSTAIECMRSG